MECSEKPTCNAFSYVTIVLIAGRIRDEYNKHKDIDFARIAAGKIYEQWHQFYSEEIESLKPKWISINDRLPENHGKYLVFNKDSDICTSYFSLNLKKFLSIKYITHWMPLPATPTQSDKK